MIDARGPESIDRLRALAPDGLDAVLALAGGDELERCLDFVRTRGRVVYPNGVEPAPMKRRTFTTRSFERCSDGWYCEYAAAVIDGP